MSWWQEPISAAKKIFPTASVLLVNVCVCVGCRREPGKTSWVLDQKVGDFVILYRKETKRIIRKLKCIFFWSPKWQFFPLAHSFVFWNNRVRIGKDSGRANFSRYALRQPELVNEKGGENAEQPPATGTLLFPFHCDYGVYLSVWCVHRRVSVGERYVWITRPYHTSHKISCKSKK